MFAEPDLATMQLVRCAFDPRTSPTPTRSFRVPACAARSPAPTAASAGNRRHRGDLLMSATAALTLEQGIAALGSDRRRRIRLRRAAAADHRCGAWQTRRDRRGTALCQCERPLRDAQRRAERNSAGAMRPSADIELSTSRHEEAARACLAGHDVHRAGGLHLGSDAGSTCRATARWSRSIRCGPSAPRWAASWPCNDSGALRLKYGSLRDLIIGMTLGSRRRNDREERWQGRQECRRLRHSQADDGELRHAGRHHRGEFPAAPARRACAHVDGIGACGLVAVEQFREPLRALMDSQLAPSSVQLRASRRRNAP